MSSLFSIPAGADPSEMAGDADKGEPEFNAASQDELAYRLRQQELIAEFGTLALRASNLQGVLDHAVRIAAKGMNVGLSKYLEYHGETGDLLVRAGVGWTDGTVGVTRLGADLGSPAGYAFQTGKPVISNHLGSEDRFRTPALLADHGVERALNVPVSLEGTPIGVLEVDSGVLGKFTVADIAFMEGIANMLSAAILRHDRERDLEEARYRESLLAAEMRHRVKNVFAIVNGLLSMSYSDEPEDTAALVALMRGRIGALACASDAGLSGGDRTAAQGRLDPVDLTRQILKAYGDRVVIRGGAGGVSPDVAAPLALVVHELATNAVKYGPLSTPSGHIAIDWSEDDERTHFVWTETGGPRIDTAPSASGFGQKMIDRILATIGGQVSRTWGADGLVVRIALD